MESSTAESERLGFIERDMDELRRMSGLDMRVETSMNPTLGDRYVVVFYGNGVYNSQSRRMDYSTFGDSRNFAKIILEQMFLLRKEGK